MVDLNMWTSRPSRSELALQRPREVYPPVRRCTERLDSAFDHVGSASGRGYGAVDQMPGVRVPDLMFGEFVLVEYTHIAIECSNDIEAEVDLCDQIAVPRRGCADVGVDRVPRMVPGELHDPPCIVGCETDEAGPSSRGSSSPRWTIVSRGAYSQTPCSSSPRRRASYCQ